MVRTLRAAEEPNTGRAPRCGSRYHFIDGFARHMRDALPHVSFAGFTGTPIEQTDAITRAVLGDYISVYDIQCGVVDGATVPVYYE